jgi:hypothetical protein
VSDRFGSGRLLFERCGRQFRVGRVIVRELWTTDSSRECCYWNDVGDSFELGGFSLERCG